ncbi:MAG: DNA repair exonuclease [Blautia sp.]|nr:DNA repair exonuclease [Blautia sp.]
MRFIHLADVHLGAVPDRGSAWSSRREEEIWETFRRIIAGIRENPVDLLFIAGDLFHRQPLIRDLKEVNRLFKTIPDTNIYIIAGNHDYIGRGSAYKKFRWAENVIFFDREEIMCIDDDKIPVTVYGFSYCHQEICESLLDGICPEDGDGYHILLAHGGDEKHVPIDFRDLMSSGFDYVALGHIHKPHIFGNGEMAYPGAPEPIDRNDTGEHGYIEGWTEGDTIRIRFVPFATRCYDIIELKIDEDSTREGIEEELTEEIARRGQENIYRVVLSGMRSADLLLIPEKLKACGNIVDLQDESRLMYDLESLKKQYAGTLVGDYIRFFSGKISDTEEKALFYGLQALLSTSRER